MTSFVQVLAIIAATLIFTRQSLTQEQRLTACVRLNGSKTCYSTNSAPYRMYGTKTAYHVSLNNVTNDHFQFPDCIPKVFYLFSRHATRYPDKEYIVEMVDILPLLKEKIMNASADGRSNLCLLDVQKMSSWNMTMVPGDDNRLSNSGEREAYYLAQRYQTRFPELLDRNPSNPSIAFHHTSRERTGSTAQAFAKGLFGSNWLKYYNAEIKDDVLQFHKTCKKLRKKCDKDDDDPEEVVKFVKGPVMKALVRSISRRLGFEVSHDEVMRMYQMCIFSYALEINDIWCSVFSTEELKVLEYEGDIDDYYEDGYGNKLNYEQACPVVNFLVELFRSSSGSEEKKAVLQFSHAGAIKKVYSRLGLFRDATPLTATNMCSVADRLWKSSLVTPFNSNLALVLYDCGGKHKIAAFHNEFPVTLGGCSSVLCPLEEFLESYRDISTNCDIKSLCCSCCIS